MISLIVSVLLVSAIFQGLAWPALVLAIWLVILIAVDILERD